MNKLFLRIWLAVWLVIILVVLMSVGVFDYLRSQNIEQRTVRPQVYLQVLTEDLIKATQRGQSLDDWIKKVSKEDQLVYLLTPDNVDIAGRTIPDHILTRINDSKGSGSVISRQFIKNITLEGYPPLKIVVARSNSRETFRWFSTEILIGLGFLVSGLVSVGLTRYITFPIKQLLIASDSVSKGDFHTNAAAAVGNRKDEIADLARRFDKMAQQLAASQKLQQDLLRDVSHELRSPLTRLLLTSNLLTDADKSERLKLEQRLRKDLAEMDTLVEEIMALARFNTEAGSISLIRTDLVEYLLPLIEDAEFEANAFNKSVRFIHTDELLFANIDAVYFKRAIENVVRNAIRHTSEGTEVVAQVSRENDKIVVAISDHGEGLEEEELSKIFTPFYRGATARAQFTGAGIGLALTERIVKSHHGSLSAHNKPDGGLLVRLILPSAQA